jgi:hypothetical protein
MCYVLLADSQFLKFRRTTANHGDIINSIPVLDCLTLKMKALHFFETTINYLLVNMV